MKKYLIAVFSLCVMALSLAGCGEESRYREDAAAYLGALLQHLHPQAGTAQDVCADQASQSGSDDEYVVFHTVVMSPLNSTYVCRSSLMRADGGVALHTLQSVHQQDGRTLGYQFADVSHACCCKCDSM